ncbi:hypothetical protein C8R43DRAFT_964602 [Mycena crocata]|nr:hypothetical protein C8R43DRAFT_964602 [Mycena crocata]
MLPCWGRRCRVVLPPPLSSSMLVLIAVVVTVDVEPIQPQATTFNHRPPTHLGTRRGALDTAVMILRVLTTMGVACAVWAHFQGSLFLVVSTAVQVQVSFSTYPTELLKSLDNGARVKFGAGGKGDGKEPFLEGVSKFNLKSESPIGARPTYRAFKISNQVVRNTATTLLQLRNLGLILHSEHFLYKFQPEFSVLKATLATNAVIQDQP